MKKANYDIFYKDKDRFSPTSFPGSLILLPPGARSWGR